MFIAFFMVRFLLRFSKEMGCEPFADVGFGRCLASLFHFLPLMVARGVGQTPSNPKNNPKKFKGIESLFLWKKMLRLWSHLPFVSLPAIWKQAENAREMRA